MWELVSCCWKYKNDLMKSFTTFLLGYVWQEQYSGANSWKGAHTNWPKIICTWRIPWRESCLPQVDITRCWNLRKRLNVQLIHCYCSTQTDLEGRAWQSQINANLTLEWGNAIGYSNELAMSLALPTSI